MAIGIAVGAVLAAKFISLRKSVKVIPIGILMGIVVMGMNLVSQTSVAICALIFIGALSGFFCSSNERLITAPRTRFDGCRTFNRSAKFYGKFVNFGDDRFILFDDRNAVEHIYNNNFVWIICQRNNGRRADFA